MDLPQRGQERADLRAVVHLHPAGQYHLLQPAAPDQPDRIFRLRQKVGAAAAGAARHRTVDRIGLYRVGAQSGGLFDPADQSVGLLAGVRAPVDLGGCDPYAFAAPAADERQLGKHQPPRREVRPCPAGMEREAAQQQRRPLGAAEGDLMGAGRQVAQRRRCVSEPVRAGLRRDRAHLPECGDGNPPVGRLPVGEGRSGLQHQGQRIDIVRRSRQGDR